MEENVEKGMRDYIDIFKRNKNRMALVWLIAFVLTIIIAIKWPATYRSTATILIEQQEIPQDLVRSTVTTYADQRIQVISQRVMSSVNLKKIIEKYQLYSDKIKKEVMSVVVEDMRDEINLDMVSADVVDPISGRPTLATIAFTLSFSSEYAKKAQQVANELVNLYLNENLKRRSEIAKEATSFLAIEASKLGKQMSILEKDLALFKERNEGSLPELQQLNMTLMDRTEQQLMDTNRTIAATNDKLVYLNAELLQIDPNMSIYSETGQRIYGSRDRLKTLQAEIISLKTKYVENHPDIIKMQKEIRALEIEVGGVDKLEVLNQLKSKKSELVAMTERYSESHPDVKKLKQQLKNLQESLDRPSKTKSIEAKPDNPAYIQLFAQLNAMKAERTALYTVKKKLTDKLGKYEKGLIKAPQVEREYLELTREYDNTLIKFREIKAKQMEADMAQAMEKDRKAERFSLIEPPLFPEEPFKPNRTLIMLVGLILSLALAAAYASIKEAMNGGVYGSRGVLLATGNFPLVVIPYIENTEDIEKAKKTTKKSIVAAVVISILVVLVFHFFVMPLDVLWYVVVRKLGLN